MSDYFQVVSRPDSIRLGWALVHFLWQGLVIALVLEIALGFAGRKNASLRYLLCGLALAAMPVCLTTTYWALGRDASAIPAQPVSTETAVAGAATSQGTPSGFASMPVATTITDFTSREIPSLDLNRFMPEIVAGWLLGVILLTGRKAGGFLVLWRWRRRGVSAPGDAMAELFRQACQKIGVDPRRVSLKISTLVQVPMTMGWMRPIVLFPAALLSGLSTGEIELLLAHELAHIRRCDYLVNLLQTVVETLFFYHPVTWWISRRMRQERENSCDDLVASRSTEALAYAKVLLRLETIRPSGASLATAATGGSLRQRVQRLLGEPVPSSGIALPSLLVLLSILGVIAAISVVEAQQASPSKPAVTMTAAEAKSQGIAAMVNHKPIFWSDIARDLVLSDSYLKAKHSGNEPLLRFILQEAIDSELVIQDAESSGYHVPQGDLDERVNYGVRGFGGDKHTFVENLEKNGSSLEQFMEQNRRSEIYDHMLNLRVYGPTKTYLLDHPPALEAGASAKAAKQAEDALFQTESTKLENDWMADLRAKAQIQTFEQVDANDTASITKVSYEAKDGAGANEAQTPSPSKSADIPVAQPIAATPEPAFAQPVTMKEQKIGDNRITRIYYQGGNFILQQYLGTASPGNVAQLVFYKGAIVVRDVRKPQSLPDSDRTIFTNDFKISIQSIAADSVSPAKLRILDSSQEIITEFFIDKNGVMRPITQAEHDADLARRKAAFDGTPPANNSAASQDGSNHGAVTITQASYEAKDGAGTKDVTDIVTKMVKDNRLDVLVGNDVFGSDPAWLHVKQLRVEYTIDGKKHEAIADEGTTLSIPDQTPAASSNAAKATGDQKDDDPFALPPVGSFGQLGRVMEIHASFSRQLQPGVPAVHYFSQYRGLSTGMSAGVSWGGEIAVYGLPSSFAEGSSWLGLVYPAGHMTFGWDRLSVYATTKEQALTLMNNESEQDRKSFPP